MRFRQTISSEIGLSQAYITHHKAIPMAAWSERG